MNTDYDIATLKDKIATIAYQLSAITKAINALVALHIVYEETKADYETIILPNAEHIDRLRKQEAELFSKRTSLQANL